MGTLIINGKPYEIPECKAYISFDENRVILNGKEIISNLEELKEKEIYISSKGDIINLEVYTCKTIIVKGNVEELRTGSGDVYVEGNVNGNINTTRGNVECNGSIGGNVSTVSGDIHHH